MVQCLRNVICLCVTGENMAEFSFRCKKSFDLHNSDKAGAVWPKLAIEAVLL
jgi:hypothetical protein